MTMAAQGATKPAAGVIATSPATSPEAAPSAVGLLRCTHSTANQPRAPPAAPRCVVMKAQAMPVARKQGAARVEAEPAEPQDPGAGERHREVVRDAGALCGYLRRLPTMSAQTSAEAPAVRCTTVPPAKSSAPILRSQPPSAHTQCATGT